MTHSHSFHIPVMGIGFTLETPLKVSQYGMSSVISLVDDILLEKLRKLYCEKFKLPYQEISEKMEDFRAKRITSYLNLLHELAKKNFEDLVQAGQDKAKEWKKYVQLLPDNSAIKKEFNRIIEQKPTVKELSRWIGESLKMGSIDVNIMTKVDKVNYRDGKALDQPYNDGHAALRGFAQSTLSSSVVLSAGMNPRLYGYLAEFDVFFPDKNGEMEKKIILKVSDYRSASIQGKYLAKKGLWVSEYRIESGLNCGGHAFATDGYLLGPVLAEIKDKKEELAESTFKILKEALESEGKTIPVKMPKMSITAQGGVGTAAEHQFLIDEYNLDSVGWGSPFLLVPEATTMDEGTLQKLAAAKEEDLFLSGISPLGVPFHNLRNNSKDLERNALIEKGRPGSSCPKKYVSINTEFTENAICTASREYQYNKIKELEGMDLSPEEFKKGFDKISDKSCICVGLGTGSLLAYGLDTKTEGEGVSVCPGPNLAYFSETYTLDEMADHIYGRKDILEGIERPHMFIKELGMYMDYLKERIAETVFPADRKDLKYLKSFTQNLMDGISYYQDIFSKMKDKFQQSREKILTELNDHDRSLKAIVRQYLS